MLEHTHTQNHGAREFETNGDDEERVLIEKISCKDPFVATLKNEGELQYYTYLFYSFILAYSQAYLTTLGWNLFWKNKRHFVGFEFEIFIKILITLFKHLLDFIRKVGRIILNSEEIIGK